MHVAFKSPKINSGLFTYILPSYKKQYLTKYSHLFNFDTLLDYDDTILCMLFRFKVFNRHKVVHKYLGVELS